MLRKLDRIALLALGISLFGTGCGDDDGDDDQGAAFTLTSPAFSDGADMPDEYTCDGKNFPFSGMPPVDHTLPELNWTAGPEGTQSYAVVFKDVTLTTGDPINELGYHWAIWDIPPSVRSLPKALASGNPIAAVPGAVQSSGPLFNDGYIGPCPSWSVAPGSPLLTAMPPPTVSTDSYTFTVFALPTATFSEPPRRPPPAMGAPPISYVRDLDDALIAASIGTAVLNAKSDAQPAMFQTPPAP
jgi:phosphatidylethanolamine-binding protein (PEBP) family uncharacterized protein